MKPTLWYSKWYDQEGEWICSCADYQTAPPEDTEEYIKWACAGSCLVEVMGGKCKRNEEDDK